VTLSQMQSGIGFWQCGHSGIGSGPVAIVSAGFDMTRQAWAAYERACAPAMPLAIDRVGEPAHSPR
jgi:hypothetical protein